MRLPQDYNTEFLPWSLLIPVLQVMGSFPYTLPKSDNKPKFNYLLCLWSAMIQILTLSTTLLMARFYIWSLLSPAVGDIIVVYSAAVFSMMNSILPMILLVQSKKLADFLADLGLDEESIEDPKDKWYRNKRGLAVLVAICLIAWLSWPEVISKSGLNSTLEIALLCGLTPFFFSALFMPLELMEKTFDMASGQLISAADSTLKTVLTCLSQKTKGGNSAKMISALHALEDKIRKIEKRLDAALDYHFPIISLFLLMSTVNAVCASYPILKGGLNPGPNAAQIIVSYVLIIRLCRMGNIFFRKVGGVVGTLKDLRCAIANPYVRSKLNEVMAGVVEMQRLSVCGWYCLDYSTFLTIVSTIVTYLVILAQVGGSTNNKG